MPKLFSMIFVVGATITHCVSSAAAVCDCASGQARVAASTTTARATPTTARASQPPAPTARGSKAPGSATQNAIGQNGRQTVRRYSLAPAPSNRAPASRSRGSNGQSWNAARKVLGY
jgi:hypothetical protein